MSIINRAKALRTMIECMADTLPDTDALEVPELFHKWKEGEEYDAGQRVQHNGILYKVLTAHTSQATWTPETSPSLFAKVLIPDENTIPAWQQPDSTNTYAKGDKVTHNGKTWVSAIDNNSWEPGIFGWTEV